MHPIRLQALKAIASYTSLTTNGESTPTTKSKKSSEIFGTSILSSKELGTRLGKENFEAFKKICRGHEKLDPKLALAVAEVAKSWALQNGVTHFTHWFQPLTGLTAEKHDTFLSYDGDGVSLKNSQLRSFCNPSRMPQAFHQVECAAPLKRGVTPRGILHRHFSL